MKPRTLESFVLVLSVITLLVMTGMLVWVYTKPTLIVEFRDVFAFPLWAGFAISLIFTVSGLLRLRRGRN